MTQLAENTKRAANVYIFALIKHTHALEFIKVPPTIISSDIDHLLEFREDPVNSLFKKDKSKKF